MVRKLLFCLLQVLLKIRYQISTHGLTEIKKAGPLQGNLILPNHPAYIDPIILASCLAKDFDPYFVIDEKQLQLPIIKQLAHHFKFIPLPDLSITAGQQEKHRLLQAMSLVVAHLQAKDNVVIYPAGQIYRRPEENLKGKSAVKMILDSLPQIPVLLVRMEGLWGSSFGFGFRPGDKPAFFKYFQKYWASALANFLFFIPKRAVKIHFMRPAHLPTTNLSTLNQYLEQFYNRQVLPNTYYPYFWWQGSGPRILPEIHHEQKAIKLDNLPIHFQTKVMGKIQEMTGRNDLHPTHHLNNDLGLDSLAMVDLQTWIENEFHVHIASVDNLTTVAHAILAAAGSNEKQLDLNWQLIPPQWTCRPRQQQVVEVLQPQNVLSFLLAHARKSPGKILLADQLQGTRTYRQIIRSILIFRPTIEKIPTPYVGIMLPASVTATVVYYACLAAGKIPTLINWTAGPRNMQAAIDSCQLTTIITSKKLLAKLEDQGIEWKKMLDGPNGDWLILEDYSGTLPLWRKLQGLLQSYLSWRSLDPHSTSPTTAALLFTSGSEARPKAVPLSHQNLIANFHDYRQIIQFYRDDLQLCMLPPFHSFGLAAGMILPALVGLPTVYHANPTEGAALASIIAAYQVSLCFGTPTFVNGILRVAQAGQLSSLRLVAVGAEKCPSYVYQEFQKLCPTGVIVEGYGITECSPIVSVNHPEHPLPGTIGVLMPSLQYALIDPDTQAVLDNSQSKGVLLVRGKSIFSGYLNPQTANPFITINGDNFYNTGDLVQIENGVLTFLGRRKRFIKLGGEMISLPAIEDVLLSNFPGIEEGPPLAIETLGPEEFPEIVLATTFALERETANAILRKEGLPALCSIKKIHRIEKIPLLGSGKTDYQALKNIISQ